MSLIFQITKSLINLNFIAVVIVCFVLTMIVFFLLCTLISSNLAFLNYQDLGGHNWSASGNQPPSSVFIDLSHVTVPGCVHLDWMNGKNITQVTNFYFYFNNFFMTFDD